MKKEVKMKKSKEALLLELTILLTSSNIKPLIDEIGAVREKLYDLTTDEEELNITSRIKDKIQKEAYKAWVDAGKVGGIYLATGVGKSRLGVVAVHETLGLSSIQRDIVLSVPTERLRDITWKEEFDKWLCPADWSNIQAVCYNSLNKINNKYVKLVILDEGHNITEDSALFFSQNQVEQILVLTATPPERWSIKERIFNNLGIKPVYELTLDEAVTLGIATPYNITVVTMPLDNKEKYVKSGRAGNYFYQTEEAKYNFLTRSVFNTANVMARLQRMQFIYHLKSKTNAAKTLLDAYIPDNLKTLIFCSNKEQANAVCPNRYYSRPTKPSIPKKLKGHFTNEQLATALVDKLGEYKNYAERLKNYQQQMLEYHGEKDLVEWVMGDCGKLSCVEALNEGQNLGKIDIAFIVQLNSKKLHFIQRIGRILRYYRGHVGEIIILATENTVDLEWANKAIRGLDSSKVRYITLADILQGKQQLLINKTEECLEQTITHKL